MSITIGTFLLVDTHTLNPKAAAGKMTVATVWPRIERLLGRTDADFTLARQQFESWLHAHGTKAFGSEQALADALADKARERAKLAGQGMRPNFYFESGDDNENIAPVIFKTGVPVSSIGWTEVDFFRNLGDPRNPLGSKQREAEQEYLLQNMVKGAMHACATIAERYQVGIAVRGTGVLAHQAIESGNPTKAQEFKNKTSKAMDLLLCDELDFSAVGAVVHYDPRVGWSSASANAQAKQSHAHKPKPYSDGDWTLKKEHIKTVRIPQLSSLGGRVKLPGGDSDPYWKDLEGWFKSRVNEYIEEDHHYRLGQFAPFVELVGPYVRIKLRPTENMYGDHDLFGFTMDTYGKLVIDTTPPLRGVQIALQQSPEFQAQHGGIWNWQPTTTFNTGIKSKIMGAHSPPDGEPLVYVLPGWMVCAAFYIPGEEVLKPAWDFPGATKWLETTYSGKELLG